MATVDEKWFRRQARASETIQRCKWMDGLKGGPTYNELAIDIAELTKAYYQARDKMFAEMQFLNAHPSSVPVSLVSFNELIDQFGAPEPQEEIDLGNMILTPWVDASLFLNEEKLTDITSQWLVAYRMEVNQGATYYYNDTFIWLVLHYNSRAISSGNIEGIEFGLENLDKPLVYVHYPDLPVQDENRVASLVDEWHATQTEYTVRTDEKIELQTQSSKGDFMISRDAPYGMLIEENGQEVYQIPSQMFFDFLGTMYLLSEEHPECFGRGAQAILDGLYSFYKEELFPHREMDQSQFELKFTQQFLYMTNDERELRIDLYRAIEPSEEEHGTDFTGGLFHVFDHFKGFEFSAKNESIQLHEDFLFELIRDMLFNHLPTKKRPGRKGDTYEIHHQYDTPMYFEDGAWTYSKRSWRGVFYYSFDKQCFSLTTIHPE